MKPTDYLAWGMVAHFIADWLFQNDWMAKNKVKISHPAAWVHGGIHFIAALLGFPLWGAVFIFMTHVLIDTRVPLTWWGKLIKQTPMVPTDFSSPEPAPRSEMYQNSIAMQLAFWRDQIAHIAVIAAVSLLCR